MSSCNQPVRDGFDRPSVRNPNSHARLRLIPITVLAVIVILDLIESIYHLTHEGLGSGITELVLAAALVPALWLILRAQGGRDSAAKRNGQRQVGLIIISLAALVVFSLGIYHLTHEGLRSGVVELSMSGLLVILGYLTSQPLKE
jgi:predicted acyltransferase